MIPEDENPSHEQELIEVVIISSNGQLSISVSQNFKFDKVVELFVISGFTQGEEHIDKKILLKLNLQHSFHH